MKTPETKLLKICLLILLIVPAFLTVKAQAANEFARGQIIEKIVIAESGGQSYALYLPTNYDKTKKFPTLFCFDPAARGKVAVGRFRQAAEKYGYIVVASNDSQNGLDGAAISNIFAALWKETHEKFSIDEQRTYAAGFSGGARVAAGIAFACKGCFFGVIGSGAGFPSTLVVSKEMPFVYFGAVGVDDYNYGEMRALGDAMEKAKVFYRIETFDGRHQWLNETLADEALAWFEMLAMRAGRREKNEKFTGEFFEYETAKAERFLNQKNHLEAVQTLKRIAADFGAWRDVSGYENLLKNLQSSGELKNAVRDEQRQFQKQKKIAAEIFQLGTKLLSGEQRSQTLKEIRQKIEFLRKISDAKNDSTERRIARRSLNHVFAEAFESAVFGYERKGKLEEAAVNLELASEIYPQGGQVWYDRARIYALQGKKKNALEMLNKAIELGMRDADRIRNEKSFESLHDTEEFKAILESLKN